MTVTAGDLAEYLNASEDDTIIPGVLAAAQALVARYVGSATVPDPVLDNAVLTVGVELFGRRNSPSGISQLGIAGDGTPVRLARDPLTSVYPILAPFVGRGIA